MSRRYEIAVIAGDGIGREVVPAALSVLREAARRDGFALECADFAWDSDSCTRTGSIVAKVAPEKSTICAEITPENSMIRAKVTPEKVMTRGTGHHVSP